jgi:hypothetical protein
MGWAGQWQYLFWWRILLCKIQPQTLPKKIGLCPKSKRERGWGEGIFALLRLRLERFRFSLIKRNTKQKNFLFLLKGTIARGKIKKCRENFSVLVCRSVAETSENAPHSRSGFFKKSSHFVQRSEV